MLRTNRHGYTKNIRRKNSCKGVVNQATSKRKSMFVSCCLCLTAQFQMTQEINIHRGVDHKYVVKFEGFFEDVDNVYILLELCRRRVCCDYLFTNTVCDIL